MRKKLLPLLIIALLTSTFGFSQQLTRKSFQDLSLKPSSVNEVSVMQSEKGTTFTNTDKALGVWVLPALGATSGNTRIPGNTFNYQRTSYLITPAEMAASGYPVNHTVDQLGYKIVTAGATSQTGNLKVYLMNTTDITYGLGTSWNITSFTMVCNIPAWTVPIAVGDYLIQFAGGSPFTYTGGGVYVAWEFSNPGTIGTTALVANCNTDLTNGLYGQRSATSLPTTLAASNWRPGTKFVNNSILDVINLTNIYTLEKTVPSFTTPTPIGVRAVNVSNTPASFDVTITVKDSTNTVTYYTSTLPVTALAADSSVVVNFTGWNPTIHEKVNITATTSIIPGETWLTNNTITKSSLVNSNTVGYSLDFSNSGGFGFTTAGGIFLSKFFVNGSAKVAGANILIANNTPSVGNTVFAVVVNSAGVIVAQSANYVIQTSDLGLVKNFVFSQPPTLNNEQYYVGLAQSAATTQYHPLGTVDETPMRSGIFYTTDILGANLQELPNSFNLKYCIESIVISLASCIPPAQLDATNITAFTANLSWVDNNSATQWEYAYGINPFLTPTGSGISTTSTSVNPLSGLTPNTHYQFYARANCGTTGWSIWVGPFNFTTEPDCQVYSLPFQEGFEGTVFPPLCWKNIDADGDGHKWQIGAAPTISPKFGNQSATSASWMPPNSALTPNNYLITPKIGIPVTGAVVLKFWVAAQDPLYPQDKYSVMISTSGTLATDFTAIYSQILTDSTYQEISLPLDNYLGQNIHIAFRHHDCTDWYIMKIDDVKVITTVNADLTAVASLKLYPNPTTDIVYISEKANVQIFNLHGQLVGSYKEVSQIDVTHLNAGTYFFRINTENKVHTTTINIIR